jgi:dephospho-CoA kinase
VIGIVGGIGSGKSEVARIFAAFGCEICESDALARRVLAAPEVREAIAALVFQTTGSSVQTHDGSIDRALLARAIFEAPDVRRGVEAIMHPRIEALRRAQFAQAAPSVPAFVIDAPLLLEVGLDRECDAVVFVDAPREDRLQRVARSRGWSDEELTRREAAQLPLEEKRRRSTHVIANHGTHEALQSAVRTVLSSILAAGRVTASP